MTHSSIMAHAATLAVVVLASSLVAAQAADVPNLDVRGTCHPISAADAPPEFDPARCMKSEHNARDQLAREWAGFTPADQTLCTQTATMGGAASYVQLLTCLELRREVANLPPDPLAPLESRPSSLNDKR